MGQKSCVDRLSPELRAKLLELLNNPAVTQAEIVDAINAEAGEPLISKSSLNRYAQRMKKFAEKNRQAREVADAYLEKYGSDTRNKLGKVVNEQIRLVAFDLIAELEDAKEGGDLDPKFITEVIFGRRRTKFERQNGLPALPSFSFEKLVKTEFMARQIQTPQPVCLRQSGADCKNRMRFQATFLQSAAEKS